MERLVERDVKALLENEQEWRRYMIKEMDSLKREVHELRILTTTLKVKYGMIATTFGIIGGFVGSLLKYVSNH
jgi:hypothetical protein